MKRRRALLVGASMTYRAVPPPLSRALPAAGLALAVLLLPSPDAKAQAQAPVSLPQVSLPSSSDDARGLFGSDGWQALDPTLSLASDVEVSVRRFGKRALVRAVPKVEGIPVEGADRVLVLEEGRVVRFQAGSPLAVQARFVVSAEEAMVAAVANVPGALFRDVTVERVSGFARKVWLAHDDGIYPAWRVRVPTLRLRDLADVYVHGGTGEVLKSVPVARFYDGGVDDDAGEIEGDAGELEDDAGEPGTDAGEPDDDAGEPGTDAGEPGEDGGSTEVDSGPLPEAPKAARVFRYSPNPAGVSQSDLVDVELPALRPAEVGGYLRGDYVETYNCCKTYVCLDGSSECPLEGRRCARPTDEDPITSQLALEIPTQNLPIPIPIGDVLYGRTVFCSELPRAESSAQGWSADPVDVTRATNTLGGLASEEDAFAEIQAYYSTMQFFLHLREVLEDPAFCLGGDSMQCDESGAPLLGDDGKPVRPYHVTTNLLIPEINVEGLLGQLLQGRGRDPGNPLLVEDYQRIDNAAFVPALSGSPVEVPEQFEDLVAIFNRDFDSNLYFQGERDFAYDGDIVFHEFTHAVVHSFVPNLGSLWHDEYGSMAEPGALNEGWSDYFSASFTDDSATGEYGGQGLVQGELGLRDADNDKKCPDDITGEVHDDSQPWTGALWDIRKAVVAALGESAVPTLDQALLLALAESQTNESFSAQAERVLTALGDVFDADIVSAAEEAFDSHGIRSCERVWPLSVVENGDAVVRPKPLLYVNGARETGVGNMTPSPLQFRVEVPPGTSSFRLAWEQADGGAAAQLVGGSNDPTVLQVLAVESDEPVRWVYEGVQQTAKVTYADGSELGFDPVDPKTNAIVSAPNSLGVSSGFFVVNMTAEPCETRTFHLQLVNRQGSVRLHNVRVEQLTFGDAACEVGVPADGGDDTEAPEDCSCSATSGRERPAFFGLALLLGVVGLLSRRRR